MLFSDRPRTHYEKTLAHEVICQLRFPEILKIDAISAGSVDASIAERPDAPMIVWIAPCAIENSAVISSMP